MRTSLPRYLERSVGGLLLALLLLMPFHAFLAVWIGTATGQMTLVQSWKEVIGLLAVSLTFVLVVLEPWRLGRLKRSILWPAIIFGVLALAITLVKNPGLTVALYGIKVDLEFIALFLVAFLAFPVAWLKWLKPILIWSAVIVALFAVYLVTVAPSDLLTWFGYGPATISPYAYAGSSHLLIRTPSTLGGPNQLGSYLILPLAVLAESLLKRWQWDYAAIGVLLLAAMTTSYSRSAWLGLLVALTATAMAGARSKRTLAIIATLVTTGILVTASVSYVAVQSSRLAQNFIFHAAEGDGYARNSTAQHGSALVQGIQTVIAHPFGLGLGTAGPASFKGDNAIIPENYFIQLAIEVGLIGLIAFVWFCISVGMQLWRSRHHLALAPALFGALLGISVVNLFLHGWADSTTAMIYWITAGAVLATTRGKHVATAEVR